MGAVPVTPVTVPIFVICSACPAVINPDDPPTPAVLATAKSTDSTGTTAVPPTCTGAVPVMLAMPLVAWPITSQPVAFLITMSRGATVTPAAVAQVAPKLPAAFTTHTSPAAGVAGAVATDGVPVAPSTPL